MKLGAEKSNSRKIWFTTSLTAFFAMSSSNAHSTSDCNPFPLHRHAMGKCTHSFLDSRYILSWPPRTQCQLFSVWLCGGLHSANQNKWPGQHKVNEAKPTIFLGGGSGGGVGSKQIHYHKVNGRHQHFWRIWMTLAHDHPSMGFLYVDLEGR